jgi:predicted dehydrogenase
MSRILNVGIVGAGVFAGYHAGKVNAHPRATLLGVYDHDHPRADRFASQNECQAYSDLESLSVDCDALIIAVPAIHHYNAAKVGLDADCHILMEKPLATTVDDCEDLVDHAARRDCVLQIGHQERIVLKAIGLDQIGTRPETIEIVRHTERTSRNLDASVALDLMIHDLDLLIYLYGPPDTIESADGERVYSEEWDVVRAQLAFGDVTARLSASRDTQSERLWRLQFPSGRIDIDFAQKTLRHTTAFDLNPDFADDHGVQDSLATAFDIFVGACLDGDPPLASGQDGLAAVRAARMIEGML